MAQPLVPLLAFVAAAGLLTITPGVDTVLVLRTAAARGPRTGAATSLGICLGLLAWGAGAAFGLTALLEASAAAFTIVKLAGAAYLFYLGVTLLLKPRSALTGAEAPGIERGGRWGGFRRGFLTNMLNPKVGLFYVTFLPQFIPTGANGPLFVLLLAGIHVLLTLAWFALLISLTVPLTRFLSTPRVARALDRLTGVVFVGFGVRLALAEHV